MKNFAILCSIVYCGIFCHTLYSQNITDSAITAVKDMQVDTVDNVTVKIKRLDNNYIYEAESLDFALHKNISISFSNKKNESSGTGLQYGIKAFIPARLYFFSQR